MKILCGIWGKKLKNNFFLQKITNFVIGKITENLFQREKLNEAEKMNKKVAILVLV